MQVQESQEPAEPIPRGAVITAKEIRKYGSTPGCPACAQLAAGRPAKKGHNETCRRRIEQAMMDDPGCRESLEKARNRMDQGIAEDLEREVERSG